ncbi:hypothetical protein B0O80DRAFT_430574 [Mortierella sp. GBAus27b]|nr:hypothetical protein B0O80DRAFT_430574 [Mortierella sp. GBAus27b]
MNQRLPEVTLKREGYKVVFFAPEGETKYRCVCDGPNTFGRESTLRRHFLGYPGRGQNPCPDAIRILDRRLNGRYKFVSTYYCAVSEEAPSPPLQPYAPPSSTPLAPHRASSSGSSSSPSGTIRDLQPFASSNPELRALYNAVWTTNENVRALFQMFDNRLNSLRQELLEELREEYRQDDDRQDDDRQEDYWREERRQDDDRQEDYWREEHRQEEGFRYSSSPSLEMDSFYED